MEFNCSWARISHDPMEPCDQTCCPFKIWSQPVGKFFEHLLCDEYSKHRAVDEFCTSAPISKLSPFNFEEYNKKQKEEEDRRVRELLEDSWDLPEVGEKLSKPAKKVQCRGEKRERIYERQSSPDVSAASLPILRRTDSRFMSPKPKSAAQESPRRTFTFSSSSELDNTSPSTFTTKLSLKTYATCTTRSW
jgi:hypothetical protein